MVRRFYGRAYDDSSFIYDPLPTTGHMQTLILAIQDTANAIVHEIKEKQERLDPMERAG